MGSLLAALRSATAEPHQGLHVHAMLAPLQEDSITLDDYRWCIRAFHQAYLQMQQVLHHRLPDDVPALAWLERDLAAHAIEPVALPEFPYPPIDNTSRYLGYRYVAQGSTLGGRVISKHLQKTLGLVEGEDNIFFAGYGAETGARWKQFLALLKDPGIHATEAISQAEATFQYIGRCCDAMLVHKREWLAAQCG